MRSLRRRPAESSPGALRPPGFGLSASTPRFHPPRLPSRLTSRSSRRRVVASLKLPGMRAILAPIRRVRRGLTPALEPAMTIRDLINQRSRYLRLGFFVSWLLLAIPMFFHLKAPFSYGIGIGLVVLSAVLITAYRSIRCPRCGGSLWLLGMGFLPPGQSSKASRNCPRCGVSYEEPTEL